MVAVMSVRHRELHEINWNVVFRDCTFLTILSQEIGLLFDPTVDRVKDLWSEENGVIHESTGSAMDSDDSPGFSSPDSQRRP